MKALYLLIVALFGGHRSLAQTDWFTIHGGGGRSAGAAFVVSGSIGQPDAGTLSGGLFVLQGGFWSAAVQDSATPALRIQLSNGAIVISWDASTYGFVLQQSDSLSPPTWADAPSGSTNPVSFAVNSGSPRFYRLIRR